MTPRSDLLQGTLDVLILKTLRAAPMHGWGISQRIQQLSQDVLQVNQGSLYPALHRLERDGLVSLDGHKEVHLTKTGQRHADSIVRRHRLAERFLVEMLGFEWWKTHEEAFAESGNVQGNSVMFFSMPDHGGTHLTWTGNLPTLK